MPCCVAVISGRSIDGGFTGVRSAHRDPGFWDGIMPAALIIAEYGTLNGGENSLLAILPELMRERWSFAAAVPVGTPFSRALSGSGVQLLPFDFSLNGARLPLASLRFKLQELILSQSPDVVHCNSLTAARICGPVCHSLKQPSLGYLRDIIKLSRQAVQDLNHHAKLVAVSSATRDYHVAQGLHPQRVRVIHNGVDDQIFRPGSGSGGIRRELGVNGQAGLVLFVGQIGLRKGLDTWLEAARLILQEEPNTHFLIVGQRHSQKQESIDYEKNLRCLTETAPWRGHVHWLGQRADVPELMRQATLLMHCAYQEPLGRVLLEASASGLPMVATHVGGTREILRHPQLHPLLVPSGAAESSSRAALVLLRDACYRHTIASTVRQMARRHFSIGACARQILTLYKELRNGPGQAR